MANKKHSGRIIRHIDVKDRVVRDAAEAGIVLIVYVGTGDQHAYTITKALYTRMHLTCTQKHR